MQYVKWLGGIVKGDFGRSYVSRRPVLDMIAERLPATMLLSATSMILGFLVGIPLGVYAALKRGYVLRHVDSRHHRGRQCHSALVVGAHPDHLLFFHAENPAIRRHVYAREREHPGPSVGTSFCRRVSRRSAPG